MYNISQLKAVIGQGARKNKYLIELPLNNLGGEVTNMLCTGTSLPERSINTTTIYSKGRKLNVRGETNYSDSFEITILDDSNMSVRRAFDKWINKVDDTSKTKYLKTTSTGLLDTLAGAVEEASELNDQYNEQGGLKGLGLSILGLNGKPTHKIDINVYQLDVNKKPIYGYSLMDCFPSSISSIEFGDSDQNALTEFTITLSFSEYTVINLNKNIFAKLLGAIGSVSSVVSNVDTVINTLN